MCIKKLPVWDRLDMVRSALNFCAVSIDENCNTEGVPETLTIVVDFLGECLDEMKGEVSKWKMLANG